MPDAISFPTPFHNPYPIQSTATSQIPARTQPWGFNTWFFLRLSVAFYGALIAAALTLHFISRWLGLD